MKNKQVKVYAPATIANVGAGFDVLGVAIDAPGDIVTAKRTLEPGLIFRLHQGSTDVPGDLNNIAAHVAQLLLNECHPNFGAMVTLHKKMPIGSGLGSSGASCAAAAVAVNALLTRPLAKQDLLAFAVEGERLASGSPHADNVAPSLLGGACLIRDYHPLDVVKLPITNIFYWVVAHPHMIVETRAAREILPTSLPLSLVTTQMGYLGGLVTGLIIGDGLLVGSSLKDNIAEPKRAPLIPGYDQVKIAALHAGAIGFSISGSGPSVFAITTSLATARKVAQAIKRTFQQEAGLTSTLYVSKINQQGTKIIGSSS